MKQKKSIKRVLIAVLLVVCMCSNLALVTSVRAQEDQEEASAADYATSESMSLTTEDGNSSTDNEENPETSAAEPVTFAEEQENEQPFTMQVTFDGKSLSEGSKNVMTDVWSGNSSKIMTVTVTRNKNVDINPNKQYVLCMKTSDVFYFNGLPDANKITGAEEVGMVKNSTPVVNKSSGKNEALTGFSNYSGEIRIRLNSAVETITIPDVGVNYNLELIGFNGGEQEVAEPFQVQLISADGTLSMENITEKGKTVLHQVKMDKVSIKSGSLKGVNWKSAMSIDDFQTAVLMQSVTLGRNGQISYYFGTSGLEYQVYKKLVIQVSCPYIVVNGQNHYLNFDEKDAALTANKKTYATGYNMANEAAYDAENHTITYTFENLYLGGHTPLLYTPNFTWPSDLSDTTLINEDYVLQGVSIKVMEQKGYLGNYSTLIDSFMQPEQYSATFIPEGVNVKIASSNESGDDVAKRYIYKDVTREKGIEGMLGFFDIHNEGTDDSPLLNVEYEFNTDETSGAVYYVTQVNLAAYNNKSGTDVSFTLSNGTEEKKGKKHYNNKNDFKCYASDLRTACGADDTYYIKSVSYQTYLQKGTKYHRETAHLKRNRTEDSGVFFGYLEGELYTCAKAVMKVSAVEPQSAITKNGDTVLSTTEKSTVSDDDYIGMRIDEVNIEGAASQLISAGSNVTLNITGFVTAEEYPKQNQPQVNGYHVLRNGIFYICLPEGVSIAGVEQVKVTSNNESVTSEKPERISEAFEVDGVQAYWWAIPVNGLNTKGNQKVQASIQLSTSESMAGVVWNFSRCVGIRAKDQYIVWGAASTKTSVYNKVAELRNENNTAMNQLASYLEQNEDTTNLGLEILNQNGSVKLNIARAEAKLDVKTELSTGESPDLSEAVGISDANTAVNYKVTIDCTEQGAAENFNYYIPIVHADSTLDTSAWVTRHDIGFLLAESVTITKEDTTNVNELPFEVYYTEDANLNSTNIRGDSVTWNQNVMDYTKVTAVRIATKTGASIKQDETYQFSVVMKYDNARNDFDQQAGSVASWRSFGHYTYTRNGATTTNSYPSESNLVTIRYVKDLTSDPMKLTLDTAAQNNYVDTSQNLPTTFVNAQTLKIKKVTVSSGTQFVSNDPASLTGADANSKFKVSFNLNNMAAKTLPSEGASWSVDANKKITLQTMVYFSKALTDITTERYVDIVLGNNDVDITCRVQLERKVATASADGSGLALGEQYQVPQVSDNCSISKDSAFTALYVVKNFTPGNYSSQLLKWQDQNGNVGSFPSGTMITMMEVDENSKVTSYWYCNPIGGSVDLTTFKRMAGNDAYSYDTSSPSGTTLRYLFVVNFGQAEADAGTYRLTFDATAKDGATAFQPVALPVMLGATKGYSLTATATESVQTPAVEINYNVTEASGNDSYSEGRSLALVLKPMDTTTLPEDAWIEYDNQTYRCNSKGSFILPIGTIQTGSAQLMLHSQCFPESGQAYDFNAHLYLANSSHAEAPGEGEQVATVEIAFTKAAEKSRALKVSGTQIASRSNWSTGQDIEIQMKNLEDCTVTVTAYKGLTGISPVTDLLSSVSGVFELKNGVGTYNKNGASTGKLVLSSTAASGSYRLAFEVKNSGGELLLTVPYYVIVQ